MLSAGNGTEDDDDDGGGVDDDVGDDNYDDDEDLDKVDHHHRLLLAWIPRHKGLMAALGGSALGALSASPTHLLLEVDIQIHVSWGTRLRLH